MGSSYRRSTIRWGRNHLSSPTDISFSNNMEKFMQFHGVGHVGNIWKLRPEMWRIVLTHPCKGPMWKSIVVDHGSFFCRFFWISDHSDFQTSNRLIAHSNIWDRYMSAPQGLNFRASKISDGCLKSWLRVKSPHIYNNNDNNTIQCNAMQCNTIQYRLI